MSALDLDALAEATDHATRTSKKWRVYDRDVLPAWIAEMDYGIADPIRAALADQVRLAYIAVEFAPPAGSRELQGWPLEQATTVGAVLEDTASDPVDDEEITLYKSTGHAAEDAAARLVVLRGARAAARVSPFEF